MSELARFALLTLTVIAVIVVSIFVSRIKPPVPAPSFTEPELAAVIEPARDWRIDGIFHRAEYIDIGTEGRDRLYFRYGPISDSGVELERVQDGKVLWRQHVEPLGVQHEKYAHAVRVRMDDGDPSKILVTSVGFRTIDEERSLADGRKLSRRVAD